MPPMTWTIVPPSSSLFTQEVPMVSQLPKSFSNNLIISKLNAAFTF